MTYPTDDEISDGMQQSAILKDMFTTAILLLSDYSVKLKKVLL